MHPASPEQPAAGSTGLPQQQHPATVWVRTVAAAGTGNRLRAAPEQHL